MNADGALRFIKRVKERTGRVPLLYTNHASALLISTKYKKTGFEHTPLWYVRAKAKVTDFPQGVWPSYTLWQFSSELLFQRPVLGVLKDMDVNVYNGTIEELRARWPLTRKEP